MTERPIVLTGLPGSGKSSVGAALAGLLDRPFVDLDELIESRTGSPIPVIFERDGEDRFRSIEHELLSEVLSAAEPGVIAGGGGVVISAANRRLLAERAAVAWLDVANGALLDRLAHDYDRPLLAGDPQARLAALRAERMAFYSTSADVIVADDGTREPASVARAVVDALSQPRRGSGPDDLIEEPVRFADGRSYPVLVGRGARRRLASVIPDRARRVAVITQAGIGVDVDVDVEHRVFTVEDGEEAKRLEVLGELASQLARWGMTRSDAVVSVGGGVVSDLAGYLAASYHRGIEVVHLSTSLLGQIDAAIGGKCGVNLPEGKNLLGAFKQPAAVLCDTETLATLPPAEFVSGMGELAKYHFLGGGQLDRLPLPARVAACVRIKADVVTADEREGGRRAILNYGHTLAHALENVTNYRIRHGEAVAVGLIYAAELARALDRIDDERVAEHRRVVDAYGLSATIPSGLDPSDLVDAFSRDKKAIDGITFVLDGPGGVEPVLVEDRALLTSVLETVT